MIDDFEKFYIGLAPQYSLQSCLDSKEDLGITRVSSSNRYSENLNPGFKDKVVDKPGEDGQYYFSSELNSTTHSINFSFDSINESQLRLLKQIQSSKKMWYLTYDNLPFKYYIVKPTGTSKISYVPFYENEQRVYKGEGTLEFICYEGYAHSWVENKDEFYSEPDSLEIKGITFSTNFNDYQVSSSDASYSYYKFKLANKKVKIKTIKIESKISFGRDLTGEGTNHRFLIFNGEYTSPKGTNYKIISSSASNTTEMDVITSMSDGSFNIGFFPNENKETSQSIINKIINNIIKIKFIDENGNLLNPIPSIPRERFENIDEWKDSCGFFDEKNYSYKEVSMDFTKTITGDLIKYKASIEDANGFFADEAEKKIILRQSPTNKDLEHNLDGIIQIFYSDNKKSPIKIKVPSEIDTVKISFNPELKVMNVQFPGNVYNMNTRDIDFENFKKIEWTISGSLIYSSKISNEVSANSFTRGSVYSYYTIKYTDLSDFDLLFYNETDEHGYLVGTINFHLSALVGKVYNGFVNIYANNESLPFYSQAVSGVSGKNYLEGTISLTKDNHIVPVKKLYSIKIDFGIEKDFQLYKNRGFFNLNLNLSRNLGDKKFLLSYINESNNTNKYFQLDGPNKKFLYTYYTNFGDKDSKPTISIKNLKNIYALGIYKTDTLKSELSFNYTDFSLVFNILGLNLLSDTLIDNDKCLILNEGKCYNQNIEYGDFFKISNEEDYFIYIVPLDDNLNPISFTGTPSAVIHPNYRFF